MPIISKQHTQRLVDTPVVSGWDTSEGIRLLLYGRSGTGKTTLWSTFPGPILAIICSGGSRPGELKSIDTPENRKKIDPRVVTSTQQIEELLAAGEGKYKTIVLDHGVGLIDLVLKEIAGLDEIPQQKSWGIVSQQQWGQIISRCKQIFHRLLSSPGHVVLVNQERASNTENESDLILPSVGAGLTPKLTEWLNAAVDYAAQTFIRQKEEEKLVKVGGKEVKRQVRTAGVEYCLRTGPHPVYYTKFRLPRGRVLPDVIIDPTFVKIDKLIKGL